MAEPVQINGLGCLGRLLSFFGYVWVALTLFGGFAVLEEFGINPGALGSIGGSIIPGFVMIAAGRALKKRGKVVLERAEQESASPPQPEPDKPKQTAPAPRPPNTPPRTAASVEPPPAPARSLEDVLEEMQSDSDPVEPPIDIAEIGEAAPKTSAEMIEDARRKWGTDSD